MQHRDSNLSTAEDAAAARGARGNLLPPHSPSSSRTARVCVDTNQPDCRCQQLPTLREAHSQALSHSDTQSSSSRLGARHLHELRGGVEGLVKVAAVAGAAEDVLHKACLGGIALVVLAGWLGGQHVGELGGLGISIGLGAELLVVAVHTLDLHTQAGGLSLTADGGLHVVDAALLRQGGHCRRLQVVAVAVLRLRKGQAKAGRQGAAGSRKDVGQTGRSACMQTAADSKAVASSVRKSTGNPVAAAP